MNTIAFTPDAYEENEFKMWEDITNFLKILIKNNYEIKIHNDSYSTIIEYDYDKKLAIGNPTLYWVAENEYIAKWDEEEEE